MPQFVVALFSFLHDSPCLLFFFAHEVQYDMNLHMHESTYDGEVASAVHMSSLELHIKFQ
jgi:hypothetical protein